MVRRSPHCAVLIILVGALFVRPATADDSLKDLQKHVESLKAKSVDTQSRSGQKVLERARSSAKEVDQKLDDLSNKPAAKAAPTPRPRTHVRSKSGVGFPKYEEVVLESFPTPTPTPKVERTPWKPPEYRRPSRCQDDATRRIVNAVGDQNKEEQVLYDVLYLPEDYVPLDPQEVFGERAKLIPYSPSIDEGTVMMMQMDRVPCLPYRMRITTSAIYYDTGKNALKNYSKKISGRGEYHPFMREKLFGIK